MQVPVSWHPAAASWDWQKTELNDGHWEACCVHPVSVDQILQLQPEAWIWTHSEAAVWPADAGKLAAALPLAVAWPMHSQHPLHRPLHPTANVINT